MSFTAYQTPQNTELQMNHEHNVISIVSVLDIAVKGINRI